MTIAGNKSLKYKYTINYTTAERLRYADRKTIYTLLNIHRPNFLNKAKSILYNNGII